MSLDRDLVEEERQARLAARVDDRTRPSSATGGGMDAGTKKLAVVAGGLGGLLVLMVGGWSLLGHHPAGIPILSPPAGPVRVKPLDPGGMQLMGTQVAQTNGNGAEALAPGPEEAAPQALQAEVDKARLADHPVVAPPASTQTPVQTGAPTVGAQTGGPQVVAQTGTQTGTGGTQTGMQAGTVAPAPEQTSAPAQAAIAAAVPAPTVAAAPLPAPAPEVPPAPAAVVPAPRKASSADAATPAAPPAAGGRHAVQLAALDSEASAHAEWARLSRRAPALFASHAPVIASTTRAGKQFFRLRTGGFGSDAAAATFCAEAKQAGIACTVADF